MEHPWEVVAVDHAWTPEWRNPSRTTHWMPSPRSRAPTTIYQRRRHPLICHKAYSIQLRVPCRVCCQSWRSICTLLPLPCPFAPAIDRGQSQRSWHLLEYQIQCFLFFKRNTRRRGEVISGDFGILDKSGLHSSSRTWFDISIHKAKRRKKRVQKKKDGSMGWVRIVVALALWWVVPSMYMVWRTDGCANRKRRRSSRTPPTI